MTRSEADKHFRNRPAAAERLRKARIVWTNALLEGHATAEHEAECRAARAAWRAVLANDAAAQAACMDSDGRDRSALAAFFPDRRGGV